MGNKLNFLKLGLLLPLFFVVSCGKQTSSISFGPPTDETSFESSLEESEYFETYIASFVFFDGQTYTFNRNASYDIRIDNIKYYAYVSTSKPSSWPSKIAYLLDIGDVNISSNRIIYTNNNGSPLRVSGGTIVTITIGQGE
jgi:hypothetical protein